MPFRYLLLASITLCFSFQTAAQEEDSDKLVVKPVLAFQLWATYTEGTQIYDETAQQFSPVDNRLNLLLHRSRIGLKGSYGNQWVYDFTGSLDFVGQDVLAGTVGGTNNGASPRFRIWNALVQYKINPQSEALYLTAGYMTPLISRESITSPFTVSSFEKAWSQNYIRRHVTSHPPGRIVGFNAGGFFQNDNGKTSFDYNLGVFNPRFTGAGGNSAGEKFSPLLTYRLAVHIGDAEFNEYSRGHKFNYRGKRNGATLAISGSQQGDSDLWDSNTSFGLDLLANFGNLNIAGEWMQLKRKRDALSSSATSGFAKLAYHVPLNNEKILEPVLTYVFLYGPTEGREQEEAADLNAFSGNNTYWELTLNYYVNAKARLSLSYTLRDGDIGSLNPEDIINNYFQQGGLTIQRGNYLGLGLIFTI